LFSQSRSFKEATQRGKLDLFREQAASRYSEAAAFHLSDAFVRFRDGPVGVK
jgi:hypothetical protein